MNKKKYLYILYLISLSVLLLLELNDVLKADYYVNTAIGVLITIMLLTRIPLLSHPLTLPKENEKLAQEQAKHPFMSLPLFFLLLLPLIIVSLLMTVI